VLLQLPHCMGVPDHSFHVRMSDLLQFSSLERPLGADCDSASVTTLLTLLGETVWRLSKCSHRRFAFLKPKSCDIQRTQRHPGPAPDQSWTASEQCLNACGWQKQSVTRLHGQISPLRSADRTIQNTFPSVTALPVRPIRFAPQI
jgi:hypothetical protein